LEEEPGYLSGIAQGYGLYVRVFESQQGLGIFLFTTASRPALGPIQPPIQWIQESLSLGVKLPGREADHSLPSSAELNNAWSYTSITPHAFEVLCSVIKKQWYNLNADGRIISVRKLI
jgi:hypothetical protein